MTSKKIDRNFYIEPSKLLLAPKAVDTLTQKLKTHPSIENKELVSVHLNLLNGIAPQIQIQCFTKKMEQADYQEVIQEVLILSVITFKENGIEVLFNPLGISLS
jgi:hypothetical protein